MGSTTTIVSCQKGLDVASIKKLPQMGHTKRIPHLVALIEAAQMHHYHEKLKFLVRRG